MGIREMAERNYYDVLGVSRTATDDEIKRAYRKNAKKYHPDLLINKSEAEKQEAEEKIKEINKAYAVLSDPKQRSNYDRFGTPEGGFSYGQGAGGFSSSSSAFNNIFDDILKNMFGDDTGFNFQNRNTSARTTRTSSTSNKDTGTYRQETFQSDGAYRRKSAPNQQQTQKPKAVKIDGTDLRATLTISFEEALFGTKKILEIKRRVPCKSCNGNGAKNGTEFTTCSNCGGTGVVTTVKQSLFTTTKFSQTCQQCSGTGTVIKEACPVCKGAGTVEQAIKIPITVPAGIDDGKIFTYKGEGNQGLNGGRNGDVLVVIKVKADDRFMRNGYDLSVEVPISYYTAVAGGQILVPMFQGKILQYKIKPGTVTGTTFKIKDKGIQHFDDPKKAGDLFVRVKIETPVDLTKQQMALLQEFDEHLLPNQTPLITEQQNMTK